MSIYGTFPTSHCYVCRVPVVWEEQTCRCGALLTPAPLGMATFCSGWVVGTPVTHKPTGRRGTVKSGDRGEFTVVTFNDGEETQIRPSELTTQKAWFVIQRYAHSICISNSRFHVSVFRQGSGWVWIVRTGDETIAKGIVGRPGEPTPRRSIATKTAKAALQAWVADCHRFL